MTLLRIASKIPAYQCFRFLGWPRILPFSLTFSPSFDCNSHCKTCNVYRKRTDKLSLNEWKEVFVSLGDAPFWTTFSGGEPFINHELESLVCSLYDISNPAVINIPTNGILGKHICDTVQKIALHCHRSQIVINVSIDDIEDRHDTIRGVHGCYDKAVRTVLALKKLALPNLSVGIHTVISKFNVNRVPIIYQHLKLFNPNSYITEIAEERVELDTIGSNITPSRKDYNSAVDYLIENIKHEKFNKIGRIARAFRIQYYKMVKNILAKKRQIIPCYAGIASAQVAPNGDIWMCCIKASPVGNLKENGFDFKKVWFSEKAEIMRSEIKERKCYCPLANAAYTNMLLTPKALFAVAMHLLRP